MSGPIVDTFKNPNISNSKYLEAPFPKNNIFVALASEHHEH